MTTWTRSIRTKRPLLLAAVLASTAATTRAGFVPALGARTYNPVTDRTTVNYTLFFSTSATTVEALFSGDFLTLYDVGPVLNLTAPGPLVATTPLSGATPAGGVVNPIDSPAIANLSFQWTGSIVAVDTSFAVSYQLPGDITGAVRIGQFTSTDTLVAGKHAQIGPIAIPIPEPIGAAWLGAAGVALRRRRGR